MSRPKASAWPHSARSWALAALGLLLLVGTACRGPATPTPVPPLERPSATPAMPGAFATSTPPQSTATAGVTPAAIATRPSPEARSSPSSMVPPSDLDAPEIVATVSLGGQPEAGREPSGLARLSDRLYVAHRASDSVSLIADARVIKTLPVGRAPVAIVASQALGRLYVANGGDASLSVMEDERVRATWPLEAEPAALALVGKELWIGPAFGQAIAILSAETGALLGEVPLPKMELISELAVAPDGATVYAGSFSTLYVVDVAGRRVVDEVGLPAISALARSSDGQALYLTGYDPEAQTSLLRVLDAHTLQTEARAAVPSDTVEIVVDSNGRRIYLLSDLPNLITVLDARSLTQLAGSAVGYGPRYALLDASGERLYVASRRADSLTVLDAETLKRLAVVPLATRINAMAVDPLSGRLYMTSGSSDEIWVYDGVQRVDTWAADPFPGEIAVLPQQGQVAVLSGAAGDLALFDRGGDLVTRIELGEGGEGLLIDEPTARIYAGGVLLNLQLERARDLRVQSGMGTVEAPVQVVLDTRRGRAYGVVFNGIPGSNGGYIVRPLDGEEWPTWGRLSVVDALYDEELDRFYTIWVRMGTAGLQVDRAEDGQPLYDLRLSEAPSLLGLNPATGHLWLALVERGGTPEEPVAQLRAYDTHSMAVVAEIELPAPADAMAMDPRNGLVYVASNALSQLMVIADVALTAPVGAQAVPTVTPRSSATLSPARPTPAPTITCDLPADQAFRSAWGQVGGVDALGCPYGEAQETAWAVQPFEGGHMYWRGAGEGAIFVLLDDGTLLTFGDTWREDMPSISCEATPPAGRLQPVRGFGLLWCREPRLRQALGWALELEAGFPGLYQPYAQGALFRDAQGAVYALFSDGRWLAVPVP